MNLNQVTVPSRDLSISIPFYEALGLYLIVHSGPHYARFECPDGHSTFSLHQVDKLPTGMGFMCISNARTWMNMLQNFREGESPLTNSQKIGAGYGEKLD